MIISVLTVENHASKTKQPLLLKWYNFYLLTWNENDFMVSGRVGVKKSKKRWIQRSIWSLAGVGFVNFLWSLIRARFPRPIVRLLEFFSYSSKGGHPEFPHCAIASSSVRSWTPASWCLHSRGAFGCSSAPWDLSCYAGPRCWCSERNSNEVLYSRNWPSGNRQERCYCLLTKRICRTSCCWDLLIAVVRVASF